MKSRKMQAWLVTWDWCGAHAKPKNGEVLAILSPRLRGDRVREIVEFLYAHECYTLSERMGLARGEEIRHPAQFGTLGRGVPWTGEIICGDNPFLKARLVDDLTVKEDTDGNESVSWKERPRPKGIPHE